MGALSTRAEAATVLFTDLVDSTAIRAALGEERADDLRREHDRLLAEAVGGHGGRVVKSMGDGVFAVFSSSADALAAAVAVQQAMHHYSRSAERLAELAVRVGVSVGDVVHEQGDCHGMPVVEAARLMAAARGGQILCSELVRLMARGRGGHELTPVGALDLKGIAEPVPACELLWKPLAEPAEDAEGGEPRALPAQLAVDLGRVFVSRRRELKTLLELFAVEGDSRLSVAWLLGPPGIGKTRLAAQAAQLAHQQGATVLFGRCDEHQRAPHQPFLEVLRAFADATADDALTEALGPEAAHLSRLHPALAQRCPALAAPAPTTPELDQYRLHEAVRRWLAAASAERPLVLVLDDVHWAEPATLGLLRHLTASAEPSRTVLLCTARNTSPDDNDELALLIDELTRTGASRRLELDGLSGAAVAELLAEATARTVDAELEAAAQRLADWSGGNPLFLRSLVDAVREGADLDGDLPRDVQAAARARLSRLPAPLVELLRVASFLGLEFELPVLAAAVGRSDDEVFDALEEAARSQVVEEVALDRYRFVHALVRAVLPAELSAGRRARIHLQAARAIEAVHPDDPHQLVALAHHYAVAARDDATVAKAVRATLAAAEQATRQSAHEQAVELHRQAVELLGRPAQPDERAQCEAAVLLGEAQRRAGHTIAAMATLAEAAAAAARLGDHVTAARAALAYEQTGWPAGMLDARAVRLLRQAIELAEPADLRSRAVLAASLGRAYEFNGQRDEARRQGEEAIALAEASGDEEALGRALFASVFALRRPHELAGNIARLSCAADIFERRGVFELLHQAVAHLAESALRSGDRAAIDDKADRLDALLEGLAEPYLAYVRLNTRYMHRFATGDLATCERLADEALAAGSRLLGEDPTGLHGLRRFLLQREADQLRSVGPLLAAVLARQPADRLWRPGLLALYVAMGRAKDAAAVFDSLGAAGFAALPDDALREACLALLAEACLALGRSEAADELASLLEPWRSLNVTVGFFGGMLGAGARYLAMLAWAAGRRAEAEALFEEALVFNRDRLRCPLWTAHTLCDLAELRGDTAAAAEAATLAQAHGYAFVDRRVREHVMKSGAGG